MIEIFKTMFDEIISGNSYKETEFLVEENDWRRVTTKVATPNMDD